jgi:cytochrome P450
MSLPEMLGSVQQLLVASNETTTNGIAAGIQLLAENPKQQTLLRDNPNRMYTFVNETLRLESPVQGLFRVVKVDTEVNGIKVPQGKIPMSWTSLEPTRAPKSGLALASITA